MTRTVLFFGDSNTRGYGVGREMRFAAQIEAALAPIVGDRWGFIVSGTSSDFREIRDRLHGAVAKYQPDVLVWQIPTGPAAYFVEYPAWLRPIRAVYNYGFKWRKEWGIRREQRRAMPERSSRRDVMYDGRYVDAVYRMRPATWPITRHANGWLAARYGLHVKATLERYLELMARHRDQLRRETDALLVFLGLVPHNDDLYPGFGARVKAWTPELRRLLHQPDEGSMYVDLYPALAEHPTRHLLHDGAHLAVSGHRRVAELVVPVLQPLLEQRERADRERSSRAGAHP